VIEGVQLHARLNVEQVLHHVLHQALVLIENVLSRPLSFAPRQLLAQLLQLFDLELIQVVLYFEGFLARYVEVKVFEHGETVL